MNITNGILQIVVLNGDQVVTDPKDAHPSTEDASLVAVVVEQSANFEDARRHACRCYVQLQLQTLDDLTLSAAVQQELYEIEQNCTKVPQYKTQVAVCKALCLTPPREGKRRLYRTDTTCLVSHPNRSKTT